VPLLPQRQLLWLLLEGMLAGCRQVGRPPLHLQQHHLAVTRLTSVPGRRLCQGWSLLESRPQARQPQQR
jgi:hypothetical protein